MSCCGTLHPLLPAIRWSLTWQLDKERIYEYIKIISLIFFPVLFGSILGSGLSSLGFLAIQAVLVMSSLLNQGPQVVPDSGCSFTQDVPVLLHHYPTTFYSQDIVGHIFCRWVGVYVSFQVDCRVSSLTKESRTEKWKLCAGNSLTVLWCVSSVDAVLHN